MELVKRFLLSRKFWAFITGLVTLVSASLEDGRFSPEEIQSIAAIVIGYVLSIAWEDGKRHEAAGNITAATLTPPAPPAVGIDANTVNVQDDKPVIGRMGL